jgi:hypothetical protein
VQKWNPRTHEYEAYTVPKDWKIVLYTEDMDTPINCVQCGKDMKYGNGYTSKQVHTEIGLGYPVCGDCYQKELEEERDGEMEAS